jgi:hypothetical protein
VQKLIIEIPGEHNKGTEQIAQGTASLDCFDGRCQLSLGKDHCVDAETPQPGIEALNSSHSQGSWQACWWGATLSIEFLRPTIGHLTHEAVLVQAWKKASAYIRYHNWFSDTLELDRVAINLPDFIAELSREISSGKFLHSSPLRMVPAPKSQHWRINKNGAWGPLKESKSASKIRPLAHVTLKDQVVATAMMLCLADRVETAQADPRTPLDSIHLKMVTSYGNRLFCDVHGGVLRHRWGSSKLYRGFYQDYQRFLSRPSAIPSFFTRLRMFE